MSLSQYDDDNIEFDFFDEPETVEATQRRRLPRLERPAGGAVRRRPAAAAAAAHADGLRPARAPRRPDRDRDRRRRSASSSGSARCQGKSKHDEYQAYADKVKAIAAADTKLGADFASELLSPTLKQSELETKLQQFAQQEQQAYTQAQQIRAPGPLRALHLNLVDAIELRAKALSGLGDTLAQRDARVEEQDADTARS